MTEQTTEQVTEQVEQATEAQAPVASLGLNDLQTVLAIIDTATQRSAFKANELAADRKSTRLNSSHVALSRMPSSA